MCGHGTNNTDQTTRGKDMSMFLSGKDMDEGQVRGGE
jgi:hypothetical protein